MDSPDHWVSLSISALLFSKASSGVGSEVISCREGGLFTDVAACFGDIEKQWHGRGHHLRQQQPSNGSCTDPTSQYSPA